MCMLYITEMSSTFPQSLSSLTEGTLDLYFDVLYACIQSTVAFCSVLDCATHYIDVETGQFNPTLRNSNQDKSCFANKKVNSDLSYTTSCFNSRLCNI